MLQVSEMNANDLFLAQKVLGGEQVFKKKCENKKNKIKNNNFDFEQCSNQKETGNNTF